MVKFQNIMALNVYNHQIWRVRELRGIGYCENDFTVSGDIIILRSFIHFCCYVIFLIYKTYSWRTASLKKNLLVNDDTVTVSKYILLQKIS